MTYEDSCDIWNCKEPATHVVEGGVAYCEEHYQGFKKAYDKARAQLRSEKEKKE